FGDEPYDMDLESLTSSVYIYNPFDSWKNIEVEAELEFERVKTGVYTAVFTVPENLTTYGEFNIKVEYDDGEYWDYDYYSFEAGPYSVWGVFVSKDSSSFVFDVYAYDGEGRPLVGAEVTAVEYTTEEVASGTTDEMGRVRLRIEEDLTGEYSVDIDLNVTYGNVTQFSELTFSWPEEFEMLEPPFSDDFEVWVENLPLMPFDDDMPFYHSSLGEVQLRLRAYYNGDYYSGEIIWYHYVNDEVVAGNVTSGSDGLFFINISLPVEGYYPFLFRAPVMTGETGDIWESSAFPIIIVASAENVFNLTLEDFFTEEVEITTTPLYPGYPITVEYNYTGELSGDLFTFFMVSPGAVNLSQPFSHILGEGPRGAAIMSALGPAHVERESESSPETQVTVTLPKLPEEVAGNNVTFVCGYMHIPSEMDSIEDFLLFYLHITDYVKLNYVTLTWQEPLGTVKGQVVNETGAPLEGATVSVGDDQTTTSEDGLYEIQVHPGTHTVVVTAEGYIPAESTVDVPLEGTVYANITLQSLPKEGWGHLVVTVKNSSGAPLEGAVVTLLRTDKRAVTGEDGVARFNYLPLGDYTVRVEKEGYIFVTSAVSLKPNGTFYLNVTLKALPAFPWCTIIVRVKDYHTGDPVEGAVVTITSAGANYTDSTTTNSNGMCFFSYIPAGDYTVRVEKDGYITNETSVTPAVNDTNSYTVMLKRVQPPVSRVYNGGVQKVDGKYRFEVYYNDTDGRPPKGVYVVIDGERHNMTAEGDDYAGGVKYVFETELEEGEHSYYFEVIGPGGEPVSAADDTPVSAGSAATFKVEKKEEGPPLMTIALVLVVILVIIAVAAFALKGKKEEMEE
ncbi:MAG: carboxypeptidase regulatory-like domain-containing protein, partial [Thermoplasmata archaeon]|nr:carboxypeptidase regulatory-like domain-containing protein [Thermoplasmata archaeon]